MGNPKVDLERYYLLTVLRRIFKVKNNIRSIYWDPTITN